VRTGLALAIPAGYEAQVRPRSGLALKHGLTLPNAPATIDADYRGELMIPMINLGTEPVTVTRGMRIAQLVPFQPIAPAVGRFCQRVNVAVALARRVGTALVFQRVEDIQLVRVAELPPSRAGRRGSGARGHEGAARVHPDDGQHAYRRLTDG